MAMNIRYTIYKKAGLGLDLWCVLVNYRRSCPNGIAFEEKGDKFVVTITEPVVLDWVDSLMVAFEPVGIEWFVEEMK